MHVTVKRFLFSLFEWNFLILLNGYAFNTIMGRLKLGGGLERCNGNYTKGQCTYTKSPSNNTYLFLYRHSRNGTLKELMSRKLWQIEGVRI
jgi:hypothetical protein